MYKEDIIGTESKEREELFPLYNEVLLILCPKCGL